MSKKHPKRYPHLAVWISLKRGSAQVILVIIASRAAAISSTIAPQSASKIKRCDFANGSSANRA